MEYALSLKDVNVRVNENFQLKDISWNIPKGTICGLIGKNGAGKTTLIHTIMNLLDRRSGTILYDNMLYWENELEIKKMINCVFDDFLINKNMRIEKYVKSIQAVYENFDYEFYKKYMELFELKKDSKIKNNSLGMQKKLNILLTMACRPKILILDEPTSSLDPISRAMILDMLLEYMQDEENTVIFSTHITSDLDKIADYITLIEDGSIIFTKEKNELIEEYAKELGYLSTIEDIIIHLGKECGEI